MAFAGGAILLSSVGAWADAAKGRLITDLTVGAAHDIQLKTDQVVQVLKNSGAKAVIMVQLADGSNGVFQINAASVEMITPAVVTPPPAPAVVVKPAAVAAVTPAPSTKPSTPTPTAKAGVSNAPPPEGQITKK